jgi:nitrite reductase/ring-hydroxylating ferredoxin subunit
VPHPFQQLGELEQRVAIADRRSSPRLLRHGQTRVLLRLVEIEIVYRETDGRHHQAQLICKHHQLSGETECKGPPCRVHLVSAYFENERAVSCPLTGQVGCGVMLKLGESQDMR